MPQQLIYTSAPRGVDVGRSGYCTVARTSTMGESLVQRLEQFSYYERLSEHGGKEERTVFIFRNIDIRGKAYYVLSRIKDAPADYTGRTNFIAHHLVFTPDEVVNMPTPAVLLNHWSGWKDHWEQEPTLFEKESWEQLEELKKRTHLPAKRWLSETADAGRAGGLLGLNAGVFTASDLFPALILELLSESVELLQLEGRNWRSLAWHRTFSVGCQPQDNPADFSWRFLTTHLPFEASLSQGRAPLELRGLRAPSNSRQVQYAQKGRISPQFKGLLREETRLINEGETLILDGEADSLPGPTIYQWYRVDKDNATIEEYGETYVAKLKIPNHSRGKYRYKVRVWDEITEQRNESPLIVVEVKEKDKIPSLSRTPASTADRALPSSQGQKNNDRKKSESVLTINRQKPYTPNSDLKEDDVESTSFLIKNKTAVLLFGCLIFVVAISYMLLSHYDFWKPCFSGLDGKINWWHAKIRHNPDHFKDNKNLSIETKKKIINHIKLYSDPNTKQDTRPKSAAQITEEITRELEKLEQGSSTNNVKNPVEPKKAETDSPPPASTPPKKPEAGSAAPPTGEAPAKIAFQGKIYPILASNSWERISFPIENTLSTSRTNAEKAAKAAKASDKVAAVLKSYEQATNRLAQAERASDLLRKRRTEAMSIEYPKSWMLFMTNNGSPALSLRWGLLGNTDSESNEVVGVWQTNNYSFLSANWSLQIYSNGAVYSLIKEELTSKSGPIRADISMSENTDGVNGPLRLLLFKNDDSSKVFMADVNDDSLKPTPKFQEFLNKLDVKKTQLRIHCRYGDLKIQDFILNESDKNGPWKLGITEQLKAATRKAETLEIIKRALDGLETFWNLVKESNPLYLKEKTFAEAVGDKKDPNAAFWKTLNNLCVVAIYQRTWDERMPDLGNKSGDEAWEKIKAFMGDNEGEEKYKKELKKLTEDLKHFKDFWKDHSSNKSYSEAQNDLKEEIQEKKNRGTKIVPAKLEVDLQFNAWRTNWLTITKLDCQ